MKWEEVVRKEHKEKGKDPRVGTNQTGRTREARGRRLFTDR